MGRQGERLPAGGGGECGGRSPNNRRGSGKTRRRPARRGVDRVDVARDTRAVKPRLGARAVLIALGLLAHAGSPPPARAGHAEQAATLYRRALTDLERESLDSRRHAVMCLERATLLAPDSTEYQLALARLYLKMGFLGQARRRYERLGRLHPDLAEPHLGQGIAWRRDYLKYLERESLARALAELQEATRLAPTAAETWLQMLPLLIEQERLGEAMRAAERLLAADPGGINGLLAVGHVAYRLGQVERADSAFRAALPRLPRIVLDRYLDIAPVASEEDTTAMRKMSAAQRERFVHRFWKEHDPDLATPENEAQLEYWSRVTQAYFLYFNPRRREWDQRGEVYVRYGPPEKAEYNPVGTSLTFRMGKYGNFPMNVLVWSYPGLGMTVPMQDRLLSEYYLPPVSLYHTTDPAPDPDSLARRTGALSTAGGRGVFPLLPPGVKPLPLDAVLARFQGERLPRLLSWLESSGAPGDSIWADWVALDSTGTEVARMHRALSPSACDPAELRSAEFTAELPPGDYLAGISVRAGGGRRGVYRTAVSLQASRPGLELSDVVVSCGPPETAAGPAGPAVRLAGNPGAHVAGPGPLTIYFEAYHLTPGADALARLEFEYTVRSAERDPRFWIQRLLAPRKAIPDLSATRREEQPGDLRRQFVTVPIQGLPAGRYRLEIRVRDLVAGTEAAQAAEFVRELGLRTPQVEAPEVGKAPGGGVR